MTTSKLCYPFFLIASFSIAPSYSAQIADATSSVESQPNNVDHLNEFEEKENDEMDAYIFMKTPIEHAEDEFVLVNEKIDLPETKESSTAMKLLKQIVTVKKAIKDVDQRMKKEYRKHGKKDSNAYGDLLQTYETLIDKKHNLVNKYASYYYALEGDCESEIQKIKQLDAMAKQVLSKEERLTDHTTVETYKYVCLVMYMLTSYASRYS